MIDDVEVVAQARILARGDATRFGLGLSVKAPPYNAQGDGKIVTDAAITSGQATLTSATAAFTAADVGKLLFVVGAGAAGARLATTIVSRQSATQVTLAANAGTTVSAAAATFGTDDTAAIQAAITAAVAARTAVILPAGYYLLTAALTASDAVEILGSGVTSTNGGYRGGNEFNSINIPDTVPHVRGTVLVQTAAATNAFTYTAAGKSISLRDFGILFEESIAYQNTGHGIQCLPPVSGSQRDHGPIGGAWDNLMVYGHDGNHYAYAITNPLHLHWGSVTSWGGGGVLIENNGLTGPGFQYGNFRCDSAFHVLMCAGSADAVRLKNTTVNVNLMSWGRLQATVWTFTSALPRTTAPTVTQMNLNCDASVSTLTIDQPDFEANSNMGGVIPPVSGPFVIGLGAGSVYSLNRRYPIESASGRGADNANTPYRQRLSDLSQRMLYREASGSRWSLVELPDRADLAVATDGTRALALPGVLRPSRGFSGDRPTSGMLEGDQWYDMTLHKMLTADGAGGFYDATGSAVAAPSAGAVAASDAFTRSNTTAGLGIAPSGHRWRSAVLYGGDDDTVPGWGISSNQAYAPSNTNLEALAWIVTNLLDCTITCDFSTVASSKETGLCVRVYNRNYWVKVNALAMSGGGISNTLHSTPFASGDTCTVVLSGASIIVKRNGAQVNSGTITLAPCLLGTGYGLRTYNENGTSRWDNFQVAAP